MTDKYSVSIRRQGPAAAPFEIVAANGVSHGESADGTFAVVILGRETLSTPARAMAQRRAAGSFIDDALDAPGHDTVVIDRRRGTVTALATPIGLSQVYWTSSSEYLSIASHPWQLRPAQALDLMFQPERLFDYVYFHMVPSPHSVHHQLHRLSNGQQVLWTGPTCEVQRYWQPRFVDDEALPELEARDELHRILRAAIDAALESRQDAGAFLSGGLDSSTVAGFAAAARPGIHTVTMGFDAAGYDEMEYARIASRHFKTTPLEYYVTPEDVLRTLPIIAAAFSEPFGNSSAAAAYHCARIAREHGIGLLLAGDGGDEIFGGNDRYAKQLVFENYGRVPGAVRKRLVEPLVGTASKFTRAFPIGKAASYIAQANVPLPDRLQTYNFLHRHAPSEMFSRELLAKVDESAPMRALREEYGAPSASSPIDRMLFLDWKFTLHDNDLVKVNTMCELAGVQVAYPMLDHRLIDFSRRLPPSWKVRDGQLRWFYKRAMQGFLPDAIINKTKHGFGLPFGVWTRAHEGLQRLASDSLGSLAGRGFFKPEFLRTALRLHRDGHASYYGELVWILMVLELWLQAHYPNSRFE